MIWGVFLCEGWEIFVLFDLDNVSVGKLWIIRLLFFYVMVGVNYVSWFVEFSVICVYVIFFLLIFFFCVLYD